MWVPENDGVDHINIYTKGRTALGRTLTNFSHTPFAVPGEGNFASMEAYWYWRKSGKCHDQIRVLSGYKAKQVGVKLPVVFDEGFEEAIRNAHYWRLQCNPQLAYQLIQTTLPLVHYYVYGTGELKVVPAKGHEWQMDWLMELRFRLQWV